MRAFDLRVIVHNRPADHPDYQEVQRVLGDLHWMRRILQGESCPRPLPGMYRKYAFGKVTADDISAEVRAALEPLDLAISFQIDEVREGFTYHLKPGGITLADMLFPHTAIQ